MPTITLDEIRESIEKKYGPLVVPFGDGLQVVFTPLLRLPKERRDQFVALQKQAAAEAAEREGEDAPASDLGASMERGARTLEEMLRVVATDETAFDLFLDSIPVEDRLVFLRAVQDKWMESTDPGDPSPSAS